MQLETLLKPGAPVFLNSCSSAEMRHNRENLVQYISQKIGNGRLVYGSNINIKWKYQKPIFTRINGDSSKDILIFQTKDINRFKPFGYYDAREVDVCKLSFGDSNLVDLGLAVHTYVT